MSQYYVHGQQPHLRTRPEPLALGTGAHAPPAADPHAHRARLLSSLRSAPLPNQYQQPQYSQYHHQSSPQHHHPAGPVSAYPSQAQAAAEFQQAQSAYLAELAGLQRTIEQQIIAQQQLERDAAYRLLVAQRQSQDQTYAQGRSGPSPAAQSHFAIHATAPYSQQQQQQQALHSAGDRGGREAPSQPYASASAPHPHAQQQQVSNPLVASALARRQRQEQAQYGNYPPSPAAHDQPPQFRSRGSGSPHGRNGPRSAGSQPSSRSASREHHRSTPPPQQQQQQQPTAPQRASPSPPAVILSAPGEPYPDTSSSGSESGETRPSSPHAEPEAAKRSPHQYNDLSQQQQAATKASRRRSRLDALAGLGHAVEQRKSGAGRVRPVSYAGGAPGAPSFQHPAGDPYLFAAAGMVGGGQQRSVSDSYAVLPLHASAAPPSPVPAPVRPVLPPIPGTATAVRQPRGPPTELTEATNFATRVRARAIESLKARGRGDVRAGGLVGTMAGLTLLGGGGGGGAEVPSLATVRAVAA